MIPESLHSAKFFILFLITLPRTANPVSERKKSVVHDNKWISANDRS